MSGAPLSEWILGTERPLSYLREADPDQRIRTRLPVASWLEKIAGLEDPPAEALELGELFRRLDDAAGRRDTGLIDRALALVRKLGGGDVADAGIPSLEKTRPTEKSGEKDSARRPARGDGVTEGAVGPSPAAAGPGRPAVEEETPVPVREHLARVSSPTTALPGVGDRRAQDLRKFGLSTVEDVLYHLPFRYEDRRHRSTVGGLAEGDTATMELVVSGVQERTVGRNRRRVLRAIGRDETGMVELVWYHQVRFFRSKLKEGSSWLVHGRVERGYDTRLRIVHPELDSTDEGEDASPAGVVPVYEKPTAMPASAMRRIAHVAVDRFASSIPDTLPAEVRSRFGLQPLGASFRAIHQPGSDEDIEALGRGGSPAHRSIIFDELFYVQLGLLLRKAEVARQAGIAFDGPAKLAARLVGALPFPLTGAQARVVEEIAADMKVPTPMHRLLQGDVGSGKTVVALAAALRAIEAGYQAVLMAPTELLAEQHGQTASRLLSELGVPFWILTGETPPPERREALSALAEGCPGLAVGTHALIQEGVRPSRLGLAVIDEQHRFGVMQRAALSRGADDRVPDVLLMSATPIPRTLALSVYGDLDVSVIDELPPSRKPIRTRLFGAKQRNRAYDLVREEIQAGRQAYIVYPLIEESDKSDLRDATSAAAELASGPFADFRVALVHGRIPSSERDGIMRGFRDGEFDVLVATTVIEVGIDVPNASVIVIEHAERFGLSQLHQLRGRVGRGSDEAHCLLIADYAQSADAKERLRVMTETTDGLRIAEADLEIRGPGAMLGTRQSGMPDFRVASLLRDTQILRDARALAEETLAGDPDLSAPSSRPIAELLDARWAGRLGLARVG